MNNLKGYATYNIFFEDNPEKIREINLGEDIFLDYRVDPSYTRWVDKDGGCIQERMDSPSIKEINDLLKEYDPAYQLIIYASNESIAQNVSNLIHGGRLLSYPSVYENINITSIYNIEYTGFEKVYKKIKFTEDIVFACKVAEKALSNKSLIYSIEKYRFSLNLDSITPHSASPRYGQVFSIEDKGYDYHVNAAYSMFSAYSIIEELGLEIRSSQNNPRFIEGEWNPKVKQDILSRLNSIGIQEDDTVNWVIRGEYTKLYEEIKPEMGEKSKFNDEIINFDKELSIVEAIHYASYIRNFFLGHKFNEVVKYLNAYDVFNFQMLVRRLILAKLGLWDIK